MAFPVVETTATFQNDTAALTHDVTLPAGIVSGDLLVMILRQAGSLTTPDGWTSLNSSPAVLTRTADGTEGATVTLTLATAGRMAAVTYRISGWSDVSVTGAPATIDPPNHTPSWGSADTLWIATVGGRRSDWSVSAAPANYTNLLTASNPSSTSTLRRRVESARRELAAASENPDTFTVSGTIDAPDVVTIAVQPAGGGGPAQTVPVHYVGRV